MCQSSPNAPKLSPSGIPRSFDTRITLYSGKRNETLWAGIWPSTNTLVSGRYLENRDFKMQGRTQSSKLNMNSDTFLTRSVCESFWNYYKLFKLNKKALEKVFEVVFEVFLLQLKLLLARSVGYLALLWCPNRWGIWRCLSTCDHFFFVKVKFPVRGGGIGALGVIWYIRNCHLKNTFFRSCWVVWKNWTWRLFIMYVVISNDVEVVEI